MAKKSPSFSFLIFQFFIFPGFLALSPYGAPTLELISRECLPWSGLPWSEMPIYLQSAYPGATLELPWSYPGATLERDTYLHIRMQVAYPGATLELP